MAQQMIPVQVVGVYMHDDKALPAPQHFVLFRADNQKRVPIWVGQYEAWALSFALAGEKSDRPYTHDAIMLILEATGAVVEEAWITDLRDETFYSTLILQVGEERKELDIRPSDAVTLALRANRPIFMARDVLEQSARTN